MIHITYSAELQYALVCGQLINTIYTMFIDLPNLHGFMAGHTCSSSTLVAYSCLIDYADSAVYKFNSIHVILCMCALLPSGLVHSD